MLQLFASCVQVSQLHKWFNATSIIIYWRPAQWSSFDWGLGPACVVSQKPRIRPAPWADHNCSKSMDQPGCGNQTSVNQSGSPLFFPKHPIAQSPPPLDVRLPSELGPANTTKRPGRTIITEIFVLRGSTSWSPNPTDLYFWYLFVDDQHRNTNMNIKDHLVRQLITSGISVKNLASCVCQLFREKNLKRFEL